MIVATSTHELRTPLHCIKNTLKSLRGKNDEENKQIDIALTACEMQEFNINDILDYAKFKKQNLVLNMEKISVDQVIKEVYASFTLQANEQGIQLILEIKCANIFIFADRNRIKQIMFNLCSNALKFTHKGSITLRVQLAMKMNKEHVLIEVIDSGIGISPQNISKLFTAFGMLDGSRNINKSGTGLGLYMCKNLCDLMKCEIAVKSEEGKGSTFYI